MAERRWFRLDTTWSQSEWVAALEPEARLCWVELLGYVKAHGFGGRAKKLATSVAARNWGVTRNAVTAMLTAANADDALRIEGDDWVIPGWPEYQGDPTAAERNQRYRQSKSRLSPLRRSRVTDVTRRSVTPTETETKTETEESTDKPSVAAAPETKPEVTSKRKVPDSWSGRACDMWQQRFDGTAPGGRIGKALKPLVVKHGEDQVMEAWARYLLTKDAEFATPQDFAAKYRQYSGDGVSKANLRMLEHRMRLEKVDLNRGIWNDRSA